MTLIQAPRTMHRNPHQVHLVENGPECANRPLQHGCISNVERVAFLLEDLPTFQCFLPPFIGKIDIGPAGEAILIIPRALPVANEYKFLHSMSLVEVGAWEGLAILARLRA